jgi:hypothetical protein
MYFVLAVVDSHTKSGENGKDKSTVVELMIDNYCHDPPGVNLTLVT